MVGMMESEWRAACLQAMDPKKLPDVPKRWRERIERPQTQEEMMRVVTSLVEIQKKAGVTKKRDKKAVEAAIAAAGKKRLKRPEKTKRD